MADHIEIRPATGTWVVRAGGAVIGESTRALEVAEGDALPVIYFPRDDLAMAFLEPSTTTSTSPSKGEAGYFTIVAGAGPIRDAGWSYETPNAGVEQIASHIAFDPEKVTVEEV